VLRTFDLIAPKRGRKEVMTLPITLTEQQIVNIVLNVLLLMFITGMVGYFMGARSEKKFQKELEEIDELVNRIQTKVQEVNQRRKPPYGRG
jgi:hypothetical protein